MPHISPSGLEPQQERQRVLRRSRIRHNRQTRITQSTSNGSRWGQRIIGALLWLSTHTRPDLSCAVSLASQALFKDLQKLKDRLRQLLQCLKSTKDLGLSYPFPKGTSNKFSVTEFTIYTDSSVAPAGKQSQAGIAIFLTYGTVRHLVHWQSCKEKKMAESSAESELYALSTGHKVGRTLG